MMWSIGVLFAYLACFWGMGGLVLVASLLCLFLVKLGMANLSGEALSFSLGESSGYECGFESVYVVGSSFSLQFYVVGLSFIIFDLEISLFLPLVGSNLVGVGLVWGIFFLICVFLVYLFELNQGALAW